VKKGEVVFLDNLRFWPEESLKKGVKYEQFARDVASVTNVFEPEDRKHPSGFFIEESYPQAHRPNPTITAMTKYFFDGRTAFGFSYLDEMKAQNQVRQYLKQPHRKPMAFVLAGAKIETKPGVVSKVTVARKILGNMKSGDYMIVLGAVAYTFIVARYLIEKGKKPEDLKDEEVRELIGASMFQKPLLNRLYVI